MNQTEIAPAAESAPLSVADVVSMLRAAAPPELAEPWDSNQLICGDPAEPVASVLLAVDPVAVVVDEAIERGVDMVITHHPLYLRGTDQVSAADPKGRCVHRLIRNGIALANAHTSLDAAHGGVAAALAAAVGLLDTTPLEPNPLDPTQGIGRVGSLQVPFRLRDLADAGADAFLTADLRHHPASEHLEAGRPYLLCGTHWATEWVGLPPLAARLERAGTAGGRRLTTYVSEVVTDPWALRLSTGSQARARTAQNSIPSQ